MKINTIGYWASGKEDNTLRKLLRGVNVFVISCLLLIVTTGEAFAVTYSITYLTGGPAYGNNDSGMVVGGGGGAFYIYDGTSYTYLSAPGASQNVAWDINEAGVVAGNYWNSSFWRAFTYNGSSYSYINVPYALTTVALGNNDTGDVVGYCLVESTGYHGFIHDGISFTYIDVPGAQETYVTDINNMGVVTGTYRYSDNKIHSYTYDGISFTYIDVPGAVHTEVYGINDDGIIVGDYRDSSGMIHGFIYDGTSFTTLDLPGVSDTLILDINNTGTMVGWYKDTIGIAHGFIATPYALVLDPVGSSWVYEGNLLSLTLTAADPDGDVTFQAVNLPSGADFDGETGEFSWTPSHSQAGRYDVTFIATDGSLEDSEIVTITVFDGDGPPIKKKKVLRKATTPIENKMVVEYAKEELESTFSVKASFEGLEKEKAEVTVTTFEKCPASPVGFKVGDVCFDISNDDLSFDSVDICIEYDENAVSSEKALKLEHYEGNHWRNITKTLDNTKNVICGESTSLSPFAVIKSVGEISTPADPQPVDALVEVSAAFIDQNNMATHTATVDWGDGFVSDAVVEETEGSGTATDSHMYWIPGVYTITLTVYDDIGVLGESVYRYMVVYDSDGGFVTGGGWINSPEGAYTADPALTGKANFGFVSKYKKGANVPTGNTEFQFMVAGLNFHSDKYEWLVIAGARAQFKGEGTINDMGDYGFMLTAIDEALSNDGGGDRFRIKIWDKATEAIVYDNMMGSTDDSPPTMALGGGSIVIHKGK